MFKKYYETIDFAKAISHNVNLMGFHGMDNNILLGFSHLFLNTDVKIFTIENSIKDVLLNTSNKIFPRNLPYSSIYIDVDLDFGTLVTKGIFVNKIPSPKEIKKVLGKRIFVFSWGYDKSDGAVFFSHKNILFEENLTNLDDVMTNIYESDSLLYEESYEMSDVNKFSNTMPLFVCNFLDFLNNPNVKIINKPENNKQNVKRGLRNKNPIPQYNMLRISGDLKKYMGMIFSNKRNNKNFSHKFWVRGHFRRYWKKDRFQNLYKSYSDNELSDEYYMDNEYQVLMQWIPPYIKGKGMLVSKPYELKGQS